MALLSRCGAALAVSVLVATSVAAQVSYKKFGSIAGWDIFVNEDTNGCLMAQRLDGDRQIAMGVDMTTEQRAYIALYTKKVANITTGQKIPVLFDIDGDKYTAEATGAQMEGFDGAYLHFSNPQFIYDLVNKKSMTITPQGRDPIVISLAGTADALKKLRACQDAR